MLSAANLYSAIKVYYRYVLLCGFFFSPKDIWFELEFLRPGQHSEGHAVQVSLPTHIFRGQA